EPEEAVAREELRHPLAVELDFVAASVLDDMAGPRGAAWLGLPRRQGRIARLGVPGHQEAAEQARAKGALARRGTCRMRRAREGRDACCSGTGFSRRRTNRVVRTTPCRAGRPLLRSPRLRATASCLRPARRRAQRPKPDNADRGARAFVA